MKQAPRQWFDTLSRHLQQAFNQSTTDPSLFLYNHNHIYLYLLIYINNILLIGNNQKAMQDLITNLHEPSHMKHLGHITTFLGIQTQHTNDTLNLTQNQYAMDILREFRMLTFKPLSTPSSYKPSSTPNYSLPFDNLTLYRQLIGSLQYLTLTRPEISHVVNQLCQNIHSPLQSHFQYL